MRFRNGFRLVQDPSPDKDTRPYPAAFIREVK